MMSAIVGGGFLLLLLLLAVGLMAGVDGFSGFGGGSNNGAPTGSAGGGGGSAGALPGGGGAGGGGQSPPPASPPAPAPAPQPAPQPQPGAQTGSPAALPGQQPQPGQNPGVQGGQPGANGVPQPGQPANPFAWLQALPPQQQALVQGAFRAQREWEQNRHFAKLGWEAYQRANGGGGQPMPGQGQPGGQAAGQLLPPAKANPFGVPQFDLRNLALIKRGENGQLEVDPYAPPGLLQQFTAYQESLHKAQHDFFQDPEKYLGELVKKIAGEVAQTTTQQQYAQVQEQQFAQQQLDPSGPNPWLYQRDPAGNVVYGWNPQQGRMTPQLSAWGYEYAQRVQQLQAAGIAAGPQQHELAMQHLQNLAYAQMYRQQQGAAQGQQGQQQFLGAAAAGQAGAAAGQLPANPAAPQPQPNPGTPPARRSFRAELADQWTQQGYTDERLHAAVMQGVGQGTGV
jgi:hypothetical protein